MREVWVEIAFIRDRVKEIMKTFLGHERKEEWKYKRIYQRIDMYCLNMVREDQTKVNDELKNVSDDKIKECGAKKC